MEIVEYSEKYRRDFIRLNTEWIEKYFVMEEADEKELSHIGEHIAKGGMAFAAVEGDEVMAVCMISPTDGDKTVWEVHKLAADERYKGRGAGSAVLNSCVEFALKNGAKKLTLITNHILAPAIHLYKKAGFTEVPLSDDRGYARADVQMEFIPKK